MQHHSAMRTRSNTKRKTTHGVSGHAVRHGSASTEQHDASAQDELPSDSSASDEEAPPQHALPFIYLAECAQRGSEEANCAICYIVDRDSLDAQGRTLAAKWFRKAADEGLAMAQFVLGLMHKVGDGVPQCLVEAESWLRKAAEQGHAEAQCRLGDMYATGEVLEQDASKACELFKLAADQGYADGQFLLATMYEDGCGVPEDQAQALELFRKAAKQGVAEAQYAVGRRYSLGIGVGRDHTRAAEWLCKAADQGVARAQVVLGTLYLVSDQLPQDDALAFKWLSLGAPREASARLRQYAEWSLKEIETRMTRLQLRKARRAIRAWVPSVSQTTALESGAASVKRGSSE